MLKSPPVACPLAGFNRVLWDWNMEPDYAVLPTPCFNRVLWDWNTGSLGRLVSPVRVLIGSWWDWNAWLIGRWCESARFNRVLWDWNLPGKNPQKVGVFHVLIGSCEIEMMYFWISATDSVFVLIGSCEIEIRLPCAAPSIRFLVLIGSCEIEIIIVFARNDFDL